MRLVIKQNDEPIKSLDLPTGPIYLGRLPRSDVHLPDRNVSRQHAVIYQSQDNTWILEDLKSANKTYLNDTEIEKTELHDGDRIRICDYTIDVELNATAVEDKTVDLSDTLTTAAHEPQVIIRRPDSTHAPAVQLPPKRIKDFAQATELICRARGLDEMIKALLVIGFRQFTCFHTWAALRNEPEGEMICHGGKARAGLFVKLEQLALKDRIEEAVEKKYYYLFSRLSVEHRDAGINSVMIAPICNPTGCFGVIYIDNGRDHPQYEVSDLDYLLFLTVHTASVLRNF